jgi:hypothetical protein
MTNEDMMRPCTLWGETFDACDVLKLSTSYVRANRHHVFIGGEWVSSPTETGRYVVVSTTSRRYFSPLVKTGEERQALLLEAIRTIADALNAPVLATEEVLAGLPKDAKAVLIDDAGIPYSLDWVSRTGIGDGWAWGDDYDVMPYHKIQAFRCSKTAEYLRQFTLEGVRRVEA